MTKRTPTSHEIIDQAVAAWRQLEAVVEEKRAAHRDFGKIMRRRSYSRPTDSPTPEWLKQTSLGLAMFEAQDGSGRAGHAVALMLDAEDVAKGDELAIERDPERLLADLQACDAKVAQLQAEITVVLEARAERIARAFRADAAHEEKRKAANLPISAGLPRPVVGGSFDAALIERVAAGPQPPNMAGLIEAVRGEQTWLAANLEKIRIEDEKDAEEAAESQAAQAAGDKSEDDKNAARNRTALMTKAAEAKEVRKLADAYLARQGAQ